MKKIQKYLEESLESAESTLEYHQKYAAQAQEKVFTIKNLLSELEDQKYDGKDKE